MPSLIERVPALALLTSHKSFAHPWVGHARLNRWGLHPARIALADSATLLRRLEVGALADATARRVMRDGVAVVHDFLSSEELRAVQDEVRARVEAVEERAPMESRGDRGFGPRRPFEGGFDRWDGGTLNRFVQIDERTPATLRLRGRLAALGARAAGARARPDRVLIYQTLNGRQRDNADLQKRLHRDTFHSSVKLWLFLDPVAPEQGPFVYVPGSHRMSRARVRWEHREAIRASTAGRTGAGGAFRIREDALDELGLGAPRSHPVPANTLIVADVRGFHRRGDAHAGTRRLALHASLRPSPFVPIPI